MMRQISCLVAFCLVSIITASSVTAAALDGASDYGSIESEIGFATVAVNVVQGTLEADHRNINVSDQVFHKEIIETNSVSTTQIVFLDETVLTIGPESRLILDELVFDRNATNGKVVMTALKGLFTFVSGSLPSESYQINTPTTTIGMRGTKFDLFVARNGASTVILRSGAIDVKNLQGVERQVNTVDLATNVVTKKSEPTPPAPPTSELEQLFTSLVNPGELQGIDPLQVNTKRESIETESIRKKQIQLKNEEANDLKRQKAEQPKPQRIKKLEERRQKKEERAKKREAKKKKKAEKKALRKAKKEKKALKIAKKEEKKALKKAKKEEIKKMNQMTYAFDLLPLYQKRIETEISAVDRQIQGYQVQLERQKDILHQTYSQMKKYEQAKKILETSEEKERQLKEQKEMDELNLRLYSTRKSSPA